VIVPAGSVMAIGLSASPCATMIARINSTRRKLSLFSPGSDSGGS
jgi:hypothetical protein